MTNGEAARMARRTAAFWLSEQLDAGWPGDAVADPDDIQRLRVALAKIVKALLPKPRTKKPSFFDEPTRVRRPSETVSPAVLPDDEATLMGEDSTLRGEDSAPTRACGSTLPVEEEIG